MSHAKAQAQAMTSVGGIPIEYAVARMVGCPSRLQVLVA